LVDALPFLGEVLLAWMRGHGPITAIGVESTGSFGATLTRAGQRVVEVNRSNRLARRMDGKSDRLDSEQVAWAVLGQTSTAVPKAKSGMVEVIRTLRVTRAGAGLPRVSLTPDAMKERGLRSSWLPAHARGAHAIDLRRPL